MAMTEADLARAQVEGAERRAARAEALGRIDAELAGLRCRQVLHRYVTELAHQRHDEALRRARGLPDSFEVVDARYDIVTRVLADLVELDAGRGPFAAFPAA